MEPVSTVQHQHNSTTMHSTAMLVGVAMGGVKETAVRDGHSRVEMGGVKERRPKVGGGAVSNGSSISIINRASGATNLSIVEGIAQGVRHGREGGLLNTLATQEHTMDSSSSISMMVITRGIPVPLSPPLSSSSSSRRPLSMLLAAQAHHHFKNFFLLIVTSRVMTGVPLQAGNTSQGATKESLRASELGVINHGNSHQTSILH